MSWLLAERTIKATCSMASPSPVLNVTKNLGLDKYLTHLHWLQLEILNLVFKEFCAYDGSPVTEMHESEISFGKVNFWIPCFAWLPPIWPRELAHIFKLLQAVYSMRRSYQAAQPFPRKWICFAPLHTAECIVCTAHCALYTIHSTLHCTHLLHCTPTTFGLAQTK